MDEKDFKSLALVRFERAKELYMEAYLARVCQVKCVSFFIFYQRLYTAADFCVIYHFRSIPETVVKRTVE